MDWLVHLLSNPHVVQYTPHSSGKPVSNSCSAVRKLCYSQLQVLGARSVHIELTANCQGLSRGLPCQAGILLGQRNFFAHFTKDAIYSLFAHTEPIGKGC